MNKRYFVKAIIRFNGLRGYGVYDSNPPRYRYRGARLVKNGLFLIKEHGTAEIALYLANTLRDDLNEGVWSPRYNNKHRGT